MSVLICDADEESLRAGQATDDEIRVHLAMHAEGRCPQRSEEDRAHYEKLLLERRDETEPEGGWEFDEEVAAVFDDMLSRSIPQYEVMRDLVADLALEFLYSGDHVVDLGASRGESIARLQAKETPLEYHAIETAPSMLKTLEERFPPEKRLAVLIPPGGGTRRVEDPHRVEILNWDLRDGWPRTMDGPESGVGVTLCVLTLQFVPIEHRQKLLREAWLATKPGGAFLLVEKVLGGSARLDEAFLRTYYALKGANGYSPDQIERKRLSLEGVLVPVTSRMNEELLRGAGFSEVDVFYRWANFAGWLAIK